MKHFGDFVDVVVEIEIGIQNLAAILLAMHEINNKVYIKFTSNSLLSDTTLNLTCRTNPTSYTNCVNTSISLMDYSFGGQGIQVAIGAVANNLTQAMAAIFQDSDIAQIGYNPGIVRESHLQIRFHICLGSIMSHGDQYTHYIRIAPAISYEGHVLANVIMNNFGWTRVFIISTLDDVDCSDPLLEFEEQATVLGIEIAAKIQIPGNSVDYSTFLSPLISLGPRVIILFMKPANAVPVLEELYISGLIFPGVTILGYTYSSTEDMFPYFSPGMVSHIPQIFRGFIGIASNMNWTQTSSGQAFLHRLQKLPPTVTTFPNGTQICDTAMDDDHSWYYYQAHVNFNDSLPFVCAGLNYSSINASSVYLYAGYVYDAMYTMAYALDTLLYVQGSTEISGKALKDIIIASPPFQGVTGMLSFSSGRTSTKTYGVGDRIAGYSFNLINFNQVSYSSGEGGFKIIGTCAADGSCTFSNISYSTLDNTLPSDHPPDILLRMPKSTANIFNGFAYTLIVLIVVSMAYCYVIKSHDVIRVAQPKLLFWTFVGCLMITGRLVVLMLPISVSQCVARLYMSHLAFYILLGSIIAKLWRLHLLCNVSQYKRVDVSERNALNLFYIGLAATFFYLVLLTSIDPPKVAEDVTIDSTNQRTLVDSCQSSTIAMEYALLAMEIIEIFIAIGLCLATVNAPERVNETSANAYSKLIALFDLPKVCSNIRRIRLPRCVLCADFRLLAVESHRNPNRIWLYLYRYCSDYSCCHHGIEAQILSSRNFSENSGGTCKTVS